ncbi:low temperature requirement protein A [Glycomyces harbinensis]|uniref:Low temperature requirement protein LtrA n=1 Tax=Glycomyces harbinensis TaxID=58114 RepID=A0A1G6ZYB9_9ACTN|nr:low temperature requirement protein A [Glycomyces harbinensis]SDE07658.1 Low temperature requirement protein LtrA [Glycomyces harbinensis]
MPAEATGADRSEPETPLADSKSEASVNGHRRVSPLELFYDLVFVLAMAQLTHHLVAYLTWRGAAETLVLTVAVCGVWASTGFNVSLMDIQASWTRLIAVGAMGLSLFMNSAIGSAFGDGSWLFTAAMLAALAGPAVIAALHGPSAPMRKHFVRQLLWLAASAPLWLIGAAVPSEPRLWLWAAAAAINVTGAWTAHPLPGDALDSERMPFDSAHFLERLRLFLIILMGETVLSLGSVIAEQPNEPVTLIAALGTFIALVGLWFAYFGRGERIAVGHAAATDDPIRAVHLGINMTYVVLAGLIAFAAGSELLIVHAAESRAGVGGVLLLGGPALYLLAQAVYFRLTADTDWRPRAFGGLLLAAAAVAAPWTPPLAVIGVLVLITTALAVRLTGERNWRPEADRAI